MKLNELTIWKLASSEIIPAFKIGDRWRIKKSFVDEWQYTASEIAEYLNIGINVVYRLAKKGEIPSIKLRGSWRFKKSDYNSLKEIFASKPKN
ncbi:MAG: helix-turn-helix domain-containing protein [bacterium]|nr:helix-turn-helix domain-containing protein [bacterium]